MSANKELKNVVKKVKKTYRKKMIELPLHRELIPQLTDRNINVGELELISGSILFRRATKVLSAINLICGLAIDIAGDKEVPTGVTKSMVNDTDGEGWKVTRDDGQEFRVSAIGGRVIMEYESGRKESDLRVRYDINLNPKSWLNSTCEVERPGVAINNHFLSDLNESACVAWENISTFDDLMYGVVYRH